jgi:hypothetical protein
MAPLPIPAVGAALACGRATGIRRRSRHNPWLPSSDIAPLIVLAMILLFGGHPGVSEWNPSALAGSLQPNIGSE